MILSSFQPNDLEEAVTWLLSEIKTAEDIETFQTNNEKEFMAEVHHGFGTNMRNTWKLWHSRHSGVPNVSAETEPSIVKWFWDNHKIWHADDISGIILTTLYRWYHKLPEDITGQVRKYLKHWEDLNHSKT